MAQEYINQRPCERQLLQLSQRKLNGKTKVRAENMQQACDLVVNHLGCDICDTRKFVFYPKKYSQFHRLNLHISLYRLFIAFIIGVIMKFLLQQHLQLSSTCLQVATWTSRTEAVVYDCHQEEPALIQWWFRVVIIVENSWAQRVEAIDLFFIQK